MVDKNEILDEKLHHDKRAYSKIIEDRHKEASEVKQCFTDFAFKGLLLATAFFGVILKFYPTGKRCIPYILLWLFCGTVILVLMRIVEIGIHKYSTANRHYGYVLHFYRTYDYEDKEGDEREIRRIGWEQAMFAWRVIQPILLKEIYKSSFRERKKYRDAEYRWWNTESLIQNPVNADEKKSNSVARKEILLFHPGSYLQKAQRLIHILCAAIFVVFSFSFFKEAPCIYNATLSIPHRIPSIFLTEAAPGEVVSEGATTNFPDAQSTSEKHIKWGFVIFLILYFILWGCSFFLIFRGGMRQHAKRLILEKGILSIQSCAVVWRLVVLSHFKALVAGNYKGYTHRLVDRALAIIEEDITEIHKTFMINNLPATENQNDKDSKAKTKKSDSSDSSGGAERSITQQA